MQMCGGFFLSDLCGREVNGDGENGNLKFLSDLCGREANTVPLLNTSFFLSDLCGREESLRK